MKPDAIKTKRYFDPLEIQKHLKNVEYIMMVTPAPEKFKETPIHFSLFLNTSENLPKDIQAAILDKFMDEHKIKNPQEIMSQLMPVGFGESTQESAMPMLLIKPEDQRSIPHTLMFVIDFLGDSDSFPQAKIENLTGWTYAYSDA
jgi:hypothetical protein